ncbi:MAG: hydroxymethylbilane synthase [Verrucomicrobiota bacterium]|nr:hydroxymethylbilane synthase [Verrucomicrobiota bacterium]
MSAPASQKIILGSRGSELARKQTAMVEAALRQAWPDIEVMTQIISTRGDTRTEEPLDPRAGRKGFFTGEIERALAAGEIDVAVHSAKDLPSEMTEGLELGAVLPRASVEDVLIRKESGEAKGPIATGSVRRQHQLRWKYPEVEMVDLRGNVPTRVRKFLHSDWQAIVLARAGLERLGYNLTRGDFEFEGVSLRGETLSPEVFLPAGGQGIIALQVRSDDHDSKDVIHAVSHAETFLCLEAEREFLRLLQGDCGSPVGVLAAIAGTKMTVRAQFFEQPRVEPRTARVEDDISAPKELARELWERING